MKSYNFLPSSTRALGSELPESLPEAPNKLQQPLRVWSVFRKVGVSISVSLRCYGWILQALSEATPWNLTATIIRSTYKDIVPGEAHHQIGTCEQAIKGLKEVMTKICTAEPEISPEEALATAVNTLNQRDMVRGFSPAQHILG